MREQINNGVFEHGSVNISEDVISIIANLATNEVEGVAKMSKGLAVEIGEMLGMKNPSKGVTVDIEEEEVIINLYIAIEYGYKINDLAKEIQENVKEKVQTMTGLDVVEVNVNIQEVIVIKEENN